MSDSRQFPTVSVIVPAHNEVGYIEACVQSLQAQEYAGDIEILVVDNASDDATAQVVRDLGVRVVTETTRGVCSARQAGSLVARGDLFISTDADTTFDPFWVQRIVAAFGDDESIVAVSGSFQFEDRPRWGLHYSRLLFRLTQFFYRMFGVPLYAPASNFAFRRDAFLSLGGYNTTLTQGGDEYDMLRRLRPLGRVVYMPNNPVYTSSRRLNRGFLYTMFVTFFYYYVGSYVLSVVLKRQVIGSAPIHRETSISRAHRFLLSVGVLVAIAVAWKCTTLSVGEVVEHRGAVAHAVRVIHHTSAR